MTILPGYEPRSGTIPAKVNYELSVEYQIEKLLFISSALSTCLKRESITDVRHPNDFQNITYFHFDSLITSVATLAEYYFSNVIYSVFGTILDEPETTHFAGFVNGVYEEQKGKAFKRYKLGQRVKGNTEEKNEYLATCNEKFDETIKFLFKGKYDVLFNISNYIKHNCRIRGFCLKFRYDIKTHHFVNFTSDNAFMLKPCLMKSLILVPYKEDADSLSQFYDYAGESFELVDKTGGIQYLRKDEVIYVKSKGFAGITTTSIILLSLELSKKIIDVLITHDKGAVTRLKNLDLLRQQLDEALKEHKY